MEQVVPCSTLLLAVDGLGIWVLHGWATRAAAAASAKTLALSACGPGGIRTLFRIITCHFAAIWNVRTTANRPGVDAGLALLFAFLRLWPRATQAGCSPH